MRLDPVFNKYSDNNILHISLILVMYTDLPLYDEVLIMRTIMMII